MNELTLKGKWKEIKGEIQTAWGKLTSDDLEQTKGNFKSIVGLIQQKYGHTKGDISTKLDEMVARYSVETESKVDKAKSFAAEKSEDAKTNLRKTNKIH